MKPGGMYSSMAASFHGHCRPVPYTQGKMQDIPPSAISKEEIVSVPNLLKVNFPE